MKMFNEQIQRAFDQGLVFLGRKDYTKKFSDLVYTKDGKFKSSSHAPFETWLPITMNNLSWAIEYVKSDHECKNFIYGMNRDEQDGLIWCAFLMVFWGLDKNHLPDKVVTRKGFYNPAKVWRMFNVYGMSNESHRIQLIKDLKKTLGQYNNEEYLVTNEIKKFLSYFELAYITIDEAPMFEGHTIEFESLDGLKQGVVYKKGRDYFVDYCGGLKITSTKIRLV
jgi:hypothetical protein